MNSSPAITNPRLDDCYYKLRLIGIYQIAGGMLGTGLYIWFLSMLENKPPSSFYILVAVAFGLFINSMLWGIGLCYKNHHSINASIVLQFLQVFNVAFLNYSLRCASGVGVSANFNFTKRLSVHFDFIGSIVRFSRNTLNEKIIGINLVAVFLLFCLIRLKEQIVKETEVHL